jgi:hypothetical protein
MSTQDNGGPAFPVQDAASWQAHGMTLLDYFAAMAMQGWISSYPSDMTASQFVIGAPAVAELSYLMADAMLKERSK